MFRPLFGLFLIFFASSALSQPPPLPSQPKGLLIDCGATVGHTTPDGLSWLPDASFVSAGVPHNLSSPFSSAPLLPVFASLRSFPYSSSNGAIKFCYVVPVVRLARYLVRTTYYYGNFDSCGTPPLFDQIVDGTLWILVNTSADYAAGVGSYYEGVFLARGKSLSVCVAGNALTKSDPFISALEVIFLKDSVYNGTDFTVNAMGLIARSNFGSTGGILRYPSDKYDRYWQPFSDGNHSRSSAHNISTSKFWNLPSSEIFDTALVAAQGETLVFQWPAISLPNSSYYIALYFANTLPQSSRTFSVLVNNYSYFMNLTVTSSGLVVFSREWVLSGLTNIILKPVSDLPPVINAGEVFSLFPLGRVTHTRDIIALNSIKKGILNPPFDWNGDPCMPLGYSWTGVTCSNGSRIRVITLNLSSMSLSGIISPDIANLTALTNISFAYNNFSGTIPDLSQLKSLQRLHLQKNQLSGLIPSSLANIKRLHELFLENNDLSGKVPESLKNKSGLNFRFAPGNNFTS